MAPSTSAEERAPGGGRLLVLDAGVPSGTLAWLLRSGEVDLREPAVPAPTATGHRTQLAGLGWLTRREREVLAQMAQGRSNAGIAAALALSDSAVAKHINAIFTKLDIPPANADNRRVLAVLTYLHAGDAG